MPNPGVSDISLSVDGEVRFIQFEYSIFFLLILGSWLISDMRILLGKAMKLGVEFHGDGDEIFGDHGISDLLEPDIELFFEEIGFYFDWGFQVVVLFLLWLLQGLCYYFLLFLCEVLSSGWFDGCFLKVVGLLLYDLFLDLWGVFF